MKKVIGVSIDDEFTSFDMVGGDLIALGAVEVYEDYTLGREFEGYLKPRSAMYFTEKAEDIHKISYFKALTFPEPDETLNRFIEWLVPLEDQFPLKTLYYGSWNFDKRWVDVTAERCGILPFFQRAFHIEDDKHINVLKLAKKMLKHIPVPFGNEPGSNKGQYKLDNVALFYSVEHEHHNALSDARTSAIAYCKIMKNENVWTGELF